MEAIETWEHEKQEHAARLATLLSALVGDVEALRLTSASLSWRTAAGVEGHWRVEGGQFWLGRLAWQSEVRQSAQLVLALEAGGEGEDRRLLVQPRAYYCRTADGLIVDYAPETPQLYEAAHSLLLQLVTELRLMLPQMRAVQEDAPLEDAS